MKQEKSSKSSYWRSWNQRISHIFHCFANCSASVVINQNDPLMSSKMTSVQDKVSRDCSALGLTSPQDGGTRRSVACRDQLASRLGSVAPDRLPEAPGVSGRLSPNIQPFIQSLRNSAAHRRDFTSATMWSTPHATSTTRPATVTWQRSTNLEEQKSKFE